MKKQIGAEGFYIIETWLCREALKQRSLTLSPAGLVKAACICVMVLTVYLILLFLVHVLGCLFL